MTQVSTYQRAPLAGDEAQYHAFINGVVQAIITNSAGAVAPTETYPFMNWLDTSGGAPVLRRRNAANSAWDVVQEPRATQAQAEAGTDSSVLMTPLSTAQAIAELSPKPTRASLDPVGRYLGRSSTVTNWNLTTASTGVDLSKVGLIRFNGAGRDPDTKSRYVNLRLSSNGGSSWTRAVNLAQVGYSRDAAISGVVDLETGGWAAITGGSSPVSTGGTISGAPFNAVRFSKTSGVVAAMMAVVETGR